MTGHTGHTGHKSIFVRYNTYFFVTSSVTTIEKELLQTMERNRFLELVARHARGEDARVRYLGVEYYPEAYTISAAEDGTYRHTVLLRDIHANCVVTASLDAVEEVTA